MHKANHFPLYTKRLYLHLPLQKTPWYLESLYNINYFLPQNQVTANLKKERDRERNSPWIRANLFLEEGRLFSYLSVHCPQRNETVFQSKTCFIQFIQHSAQITSETKLNYPKFNLKKKKQGSEREGEKNWVFLMLFCFYSGLERHKEDVNM